MGFLDWLFGTQTTTTLEVEDGQWRETEWRVSGGDIVPAPRQEPIHIRTRHIDTDRKPEPPGRCRTVEHVEGSARYVDHPPCPGICSPSRIGTEYYSTSAGEWRTWTAQNQKDYEESLTWDRYAENG